MRWNKALKIIETALAVDRDIEVVYHRKHNTQMYHWDKVYTISEYTYKGEQCRVVCTYGDVIDGATHIIDSVEVKGE